MKTPLNERYDPATYRSGTRNGVTTWVFSSNVPHRAPLLCYIAGIEVPVLSASLNYGIFDGQNVPACRIALFPDPALQRLGAEDRIPMVLFYLDEYIDPEKPTWRMLFEGEVVGWNYSNTAMGRSVALDCVMDIALWTQLFLFYMTTVGGVAEGLVDQDQQGGAITQAVAEMPYALFHRGLMPEVAELGKQATPTPNPGTPAATGDSTKAPNPGSEQFITRPFDLAYNVIRALISSKIPAKMRCMPAVNFFSRWTRRQNFHNKWVALPFLDDQYNTTEPMPTVKKDQPPGVFPIFRAVKADFAINAIQSQIVNEYSGGSILEMLKKVYDIVYMELVMLPTPAYVKTTLAAEILGPGPIYLGTPLVGASAQQASNSAAQGLPSSFSTPYSSTPRQPGRLTNYFVKPQCFFALAPVCNVIFPSMTPQLTYSENYVTQPTRLYVEDQALSNLLANEENPDRILTNVLARGYPPAIDRRYREKTNAMYLTGKNILLYPEEFFKGPVTSKVQAPSWFWAFQAGLQTQPTAPAGSNSDFVAEADPKTVPLAKGETSLTEGSLYKLYAQYEFYRQRFERRTGAVECAFNPYLVPGFPCVVFDDVITSRFHLVGYLMNVSHTFTSNSVSTAMNFQYGRTIYEFMVDIANEIDHPQDPTRKGLAIASAPPDPIPEVRDILQHEAYADQFYGQLLWRRTAESSGPYGTQPTVCRIRDLLKFVKPDGTLTDIRIEGKNENLLAKERAVLAASKTGIALFNSTPLLERFVKTWSSNLWTESDISQIGVAHPEIKQAITALIELRKVATSGGYGSLASALTDFLNWSKNGYTGAKNELPLLLNSIDKAISQPPSTTHNLNNAASWNVVPTPGLEPLFDSYDAAMKYVARPICTLEEYITFIGGVREGPIDDVAYKAATDTGTPSARYYSRIRYLKGATAADDAKVTDAQQGIPPDAAPVDPNAVGPPVPVKVTSGEAVGDDFPVMRAPWDQILLAHRANIYGDIKLSR